MTRISQKEKILNHLKKFGSITQLEAINLYWDWRLSDKIYRLKKDGYNIKTETLKVKRADKTDAYVSKYSLEDMIEENMNHIPNIL